MTKIECRCGNVINVTNENNEFDLVPGSWIEFVCQKIETGTMTERDFFESFLSVHQTVYKCSNCYRFWFEGKDGAFVSYIPEYKCEESVSKKVEIKIPLWKKLLTD